MLHITRFHLNNIFFQQQISGCQGLGIVGERGWRWVWLQKGNKDPCGNGTVQYFDCGARYTNLHV